ncbi:hypothetical protein OHA70_22360 [Kribbella sp. NBC_00382]|uniref:hypothetical protein n=1 Tax=Kribbella sp. NBC_00382 TaxID=2975967 RepID=UPI002E1E1B35
MTAEDSAQNPADPSSMADSSSLADSSSMADSSYTADTSYTADLWQPPWWLLAFAPFCWLLICALVLNARGWQVALAAGLLLAPIGMPIPLALRWIKNHPRLAGFYVGPLTFTATVLIASLPLWLCAAVTLSATLLALTITTIRASSLS